MGKARRQLSVAGLMAVTAACALVLACCLVPLGKLRAWNRLAGRAWGRIDVLIGAYPPGVSPSVWDYAVGWTRTARANIIFSPEHVSHDELARLADDLDSEPADPAGPETMLRIWRRLAGTGPAGRSYVRRHEMNVLAPLIGDAIRRGQPADADPAAWRSVAERTESACSHVYYRSQEDRFRDTDGAEGLEIALEGLIAAGPLDRAGVRRVWAQLARVDDFGGRFVESERTALDAELDRRLSDTTPPTGNGTKP